MLLIHNPRAVRAPYSAPLRGIMNIARVRENRAWLAAWPQLNPAPTPLWGLGGLARRLGLAGISLKDESLRSPLGSFKALGASVALLRLIQRLHPNQGFHPNDLLAGKHADALREFTAISATDGNHGRSLAAAAQSVGCRCVIVLHREVSEEREAPIAALGAQIVRIAGNYDESVQEAARLAAEHGWHVVSDTSYDGYEDIPRDVMQGYGTIVDELLEQVPSGATLGCPWTHVFVQGGVGGLAAGIVSYFCERYGEMRPVFVVVEPEQADCLQQSALLGRPARATGSVDSLMAGLACGETSPLAWRFLEPAADFFLTIGDAQAERAMRMLAEPAELAEGDVPVVSGESGAAGLAGLLVIAESAALCEQAGLTATSRVLLLNTEGATAPALYERLVGRSAEAVRAAQVRAEQSRA